MSFIRNNISLSNTKLTEYVAKEIISSYLAGDFAEVVEGLTDIHGQKLLR